MTPDDLSILKAERLRQAIRIEARRFTLQVLLALVLAFGIGVAVGRAWR